MEEESDRGILDKILYLFKKPHLQNGADLTEEINDLMDEGHAKGFITDEESEMVHGVLELKETTASSIMIPRTDISSASIDSTLGDLINLVTTCGHTRIPIYRENIDEIIGILHAKDLLKQLGEDPDAKISQDFLRKAYYVPGSKKVSSLLRELQTKKTHMAVVTDEYGGTAGIITIEDIIEEIVGDIQDEHDHEQPLLTIIDENTILVDARMEVEKLEEHFNIDLPEGEYESVGGFIILILEKIPETGEVFQYKNLEFTIEAADKRKIGRVRINRKAQPDEDSKEEARY